MEIVEVLRTAPVARKKPKEHLSFGDRLRRVRTGLGVSGPELARRMNLRDPTYVSKLETGVIKNPTLGTLQKMADALGVAVSELTGEVGGEVEKAIMSSDLPDEDKRTLVRIYKSLRPERDR